MRRSPDPADGEPAVPEVAPRRGRSRVLFFGLFLVAVLVLWELVKRREIRPARPESERPFRRAITETPRHDAEVVLG